MLRRVSQIHDSGCFVACVAMLLEISYEEAFVRLFPGVRMPDPNDQQASGTVGKLIEESLALMPRVGLEPQKANLRNVKSLRKRTSFIVLRWKYEPQLSHGVVFDGTTGHFLDPCYEQPLNHQTYNRNLESIYYIKRISDELSISNPDAHGNQSAGGLPNGGSLPSSQEIAGNAIS